MRARLPRPVRAMLSEVRGVHHWQGHQGNKEREKEENKLKVTKKEREALLLLLCGRILHIGRVIKVIKGKEGRKKERKKESKNERGIAFTPTKRQTDGHEGS